MKPPKLVFHALFPSPSSYKHQFHDVTSGFTRLSIKTKYVCHGLISPYAKFYNNPTIRTENLLSRWGKEKELFSFDKKSFFKPKLLKFIYNKRYSVA